MLTNTVLARSNQSGLATATEITTVILPPMEPTPTPTPAPPCEAELKLSFDPVAPGSCGPYELVLRLTNTGSDATTNTRVNLQPMVGSQ